MLTPMPSPDGPLPDQHLIDAARSYARHVTGQGVQRITLALTDGTKRKIEVPDPIAHASEWPPEEGWGVRGDQGSCNGKVFRLTGKPLAVFAALVSAGARGVTLAELKRSVWDEHSEDRTVQNAVSKLRHFVREGLGLSEDQDPVEADGERYRLAAA